MMIFMQSFTTDKEFPCSKKLLHSWSKLFLQKFRWCLTFGAVYISFYIGLMRENLILLHVNIKGEHQQSNQRSLETIIAFIAFH